MDKKENIIRDKSYQFALRIIKLYQELSKQNEFVICKQVLRSGTSMARMLALLNNLRI